MVNANFLRAGFQASAIEAVPIDFGEWLPDLPERDNPGAIEALNVIPSEASYVPFPQLVASTQTVPGLVRGASFVFDQKGETQLYAADVNGIYTRVGGNMSQRLVVPYTFFEDFMWQFVPFGPNIVALHPQLVPHAGEIGGASLFTPLGGSPPIAACGARVGDFLVLGNLDNENDLSGARQPQRIRWSGFNNIDAPWISDPATQADFNDMPSEGGAVMGIAGREFGTVFQERCISRMTYVGLPSVFDIETVEEERGSICTGGIVDIGAFIFFIANEGFFVWNGTNATPIGDNKVNRWFFNKLNYAARNRIVGAFDIFNGCVMWAFPTGNGKALTDIIVYSYRENRFSHAAVNVDFLMSGATLDTSLDDLTLNLDTQYPVTFDDGSFRGGKPALAAFDAAHKYAMFSGAPMAATLDTGEFGTPVGARVFVNSARPLIDVNAPVVTVQVAQRDQLLGDNLVFSTATIQEITGECPVLADARYMRFRANVPAGVGWRHARGMEVWRKATGRR